VRLAIQSWASGKVLVCFSRTTSIYALRRIVARRMMLVVFMEMGRSYRSHQPYSKVKTISISRSRGTVFPQAESIQTCILAVLISLKRTSSTRKSGSSSISNTQCQHLKKGRRIRSTLNRSIKRPDALLFLARAVTV